MNECALTRYALYALPRHSVPVMQTPLSDLLPHHQQGKSGGDRLCNANGCLKLPAFTGSSGRLAGAQWARGQPEGPPSTGSTLMMPASMASICCVSCPGAACWGKHRAPLNQAAQHSIAHFHASPHPAAVSGVCCAALAAKHAER